MHTQDTSASSPFPQTENGTFTAGQCQMLQWAASWWEGMEEIRAGSILTEAGRLVGLHGRGCGEGRLRQHKPRHQKYLIPVTMLGHKDEVRVTSKRRWQHQNAELCIGDQKKSIVQDKAAFLRPYFRFLLFFLMMAIMPCGSAPMAWVCTITVFSSPSICCKKQHREGSTAVTLSWPGKGWWNNLPSANAHKISEFSWIIDLGRETEKLKWLKLADQTAFGLP